VDGLISAARDNPLAAALIGGGALWLLIGNDKLKNAATSVNILGAPAADLDARRRRGRTSAFETGYDSMRDRASRMQEATSHGFQETARNAGRSASDAISGTADTVRDRFDDGVAATQEMWEGLGRTIPSKQTLGQAQASLTEMFERQPLVLGAVGLAIGATVASALAKSSLENEWIGEFSDSLKADLTARAETVSQSVREASDTLKAEFVEVGAEYADRVRQASRDAMDAAGEKLR
jgi:hypothetical protein